MTNDPVDSRLELHDVEHPMLKAGVHTNLDDAWPDSRHGLPVGRQKTLLHAAGLMSRVAASVRGEGPEVIQRRANREDTYREIDSFISRLR